MLKRSAKIWYDTQSKAIKGKCGFPKRKNRSKGNSVWVTDELFRFEEIDGRWRLWIGPVTKTNSKEVHTLEYLNVKFHRKPTALPKSLRIKCRHNRFTVSFCFDDGFDDRQCLADKQNLAWLKKVKPEWLEQYTVGIDRGIARPIQANGDYYKPDEAARRKHKHRERYIKRYQRTMATQKKGSQRRLKTCRKIASLHETSKNVRENFLHHVTRALVDNPNNKLFILEDLKLKNMTRKPKPKKDPLTGQWLKNKARAKAGLNKALLSQGLFQFEVFLKYKATRELKPVFKINRYQTSQECAACGHTHKDNRKDQALFVCQRCGNIDNADHNAEKVIKKRAIKLFLDSGTELSARGVLIPADTGRGAKGKT